MSARSLKYKFGRGFDYNEMLARQGGVCAICGLMPKNKRLHVDHDHKTGKVRALLCNGCNTGIGHFAEDCERMVKAAAYIKRHAVGRNLWGAELP